MSFPLPVTLSDLDSNVAAVESQLDRLYAALPVSDDQLIQSFQTANHQATILSHRILAERADAHWSDRASLEHLIQELKAAAEEKRNQQRRARLLDLATELEAGRVKHRLESRTTLLNNLRSQTIAELRAKAALPEQSKELPGPAAHEWLLWAFDLQDDNDAALLSELRNDFPALERFTAEMEEMYWIAPEREASQPRGPQPPDKPSTGSSGSVSAAAGASAKSPTAKGRNVSEMQAAEPEAVVARAYERHAEEPAGKSKKTSAVASSSADNEILLRSESPSVEPAVEPAVVGTREQANPANMHEAPAPLPTIFAAAAGEETSDDDEKAGSIFRRLFARKRSSVTWAIAGGFVVLSVLFFSVIYYMHERSGDKPEPTVEAATSNAAGSSAAAATPNGTASAAPNTDPVSKATLLHKQPAEGPQESILLSLENCDRGATHVIECWGYASNLGATTSRVSLDRVDVVDGRGNSFSLDRRGLFAFPSGQSSYIPAGSRVKFAVNVPDKDLEARTLTLYMDLSNPHSLEYTFRNVPVAE